MMKKRILNVVAAMLCVMALFVSGVAPAHADAPPSGEGDVVVHTEEFRWYYRTHNGVKEMRLWSITYGYWVIEKQQPHRFRGHPGGCWWLSVCFRRQCADRT